MREPRRDTPAYRCDKFEEQAEFWRSQYENSIKYNRRRTDRLERKVNNRDLLEKAVCVMIVLVGVAFFVAVANGYLDWLAGR